MIAVVAAMASTGCRDRTETTVYGGPPAPPPSPSPSAPTVAPSKSGLVQSYLEKREPHHAGHVKVHRDGVPDLPLEGIELWRADIEVPDGWSYACFVQGEIVWCNDEPGALQRLVRAQGLGKQATKLSDSQWINLVRFEMTGAVIVSTPDEAKRLVAGAPDKATSRVASPRVTRADGRVVVHLFFAPVANDSGPIGLVSREVSIGSDDSVSVKDEKLFERAP